MEFGDEYDQFLQKEKRKRKHPNKIINKFLTDPIFRYITIGIGALLIFLTIYTIYKNLTKETLIYDNRFTYIYHDAIEIDEAYYEKNYLSIYEEATDERTAIVKMIKEYYDLAVINTKLVDNKTNVENYVGLYSPQFANDLNTIFVNSKGARINRVSSASYECYTDPQTNKCYTNLNKYIFDKFILLSTPERIFNDIVSYQNAIYQNYYVANKKYNNSYKYPLRSSRKHDSLNMITYYQDYKKISASDNVAINNELKFYEEIIRYFLENYDKLNAPTLKSVTVNGKSQEMSRYINSNYVKYVNLKPLIRNGILVDIEVEIDLVPKSIHSEYRNLVRDSEKWIKSGIATTKYTASKIWKALFNGTDYGFVPFQVDVISGEFRDYVSLIRNQGAINYNPLLDLENEYDTEITTYYFNNPLIIYNEIVRTTVKNNPETIEEKVKLISDAYAIRAKDMFAKEILAGGYLDYSWDYIFNSATSNLSISKDLDIRGFAVGVQVSIHVKNENGAIIGTHIIPDSEITISGNNIRLN